ncbi:MAG: tetratricopeptide repeat protein, partial [Gammaproteobacteria bacterium]|nr:tetratricopeptide repeat protein [Gammaproteobacteria bacterium]
AEACFRRVLALQPNAAEVHNSLGMALNAQGRFGEAETSFRRALAFQPNDVAALIGLGNALSHSGRPGDAESCYRRALALQPDSIEVLNNLGTTLSDQGRPAEAEASFRHALVLQPNDPVAHNNLGNALNNLGCPAEAEASFRRALALKPDFAFAHNNLGSTLKNLHRPDEAEVCFRRTLALKPDAMEANFNLGDILVEVGRPSEAEPYFRRVLVLQPDHAPAREKLGGVLMALDRPADAELCFRRVLEFQPDDASAHNNLGYALEVLGRYVEAEASYRSALALRPDYAAAHGNLGGTFNTTGRFAEAEACFRRALALDPTDIVTRSNLLFSMAYRGDIAAMALEEARQYGECVAALASKRYTEWVCEQPPKRLRVGVVSGDLCTHVVSYFLEALLRGVDADRIELMAYPTRPREDDTSRRLRAYFTAWKPLTGLSDADAAACIHADGVHVLIDLSGHTSHNRLPMFAYKPAPVQVSWLGYFATTGVAAMDYLIADPWTLPEAEEAYFTETTWRLPETRLCFTPPDADVSVGPLPALTNGYVTFGCFNNLAKMNDGVVALWSRVLAAVPSSRLLLKARQMNDVSVQQNVFERFAAHGIGAERLILEEPVPRVEYLAAYQRLDIALDPFPYPGGTTSAEALWMGVPVLTLAGERFLSRQGVGLLMNTGLSEWVAVDSEDYVARAVSHASDLQALASVRATLRERFLTSPICDAKRFARHFEQALEGMWASYVART